MNHSSDTERSRLDVEVLTHQGQEVRHVFNWYFRFVNPGRKETDIGLEWIRLATRNTYTGPVKFACCSFVIEGDLDVVVCL